MRLAKLYVRTAVLAALAIAGSACQTAKKPVSLLPPAKAPALKAAQPTTQAPVAKPETQVAQAQEQPAQKPASAEPNPTTSAPVPDPVGDLIARAEKEYQAGLANHQAGKAEEAKQNFDNALNALLTSNLDIRSDDRLQKEFDRVVAGVNELYPGGTADTEAQQKSEPAPIDETNGITPAADADIKAKAQAEIKNTRSDLPLMMTDQVAGYITYFSNHGRGSFERAYSRSGRYHDMIVSTLKEEGLPQELIYLAQAESGFHPLAVSRAGARGIWQFMASRGRGYGLYHNMWVDDRQDPVKSTRAAAHHLKDLYNQFGDWYLAMAAYNSGPGTVQSAVKRTGYADFWELYRRNVLPKETRNYVPIILAMTLIAKDPARWGVRVEHDPAQKLDVVSPGHPMDLHLAADVTDTSVATLRQLNPALLGYKTPDDPNFTLYLPAGTAKRFQTEMEKIPADKWMSWRFHRMQEGDTLASVAREYHVTEASLVSVNRIARDDPPAAGTALVVHAAAQADLRVLRYRVKKGDTLEGIAERFGVTASDLRRWNHLSSAHAPVGARLKIVQGEETAPHSKQASSKHSPHPSTDATEPSSRQSKTSYATETTAKQSATAVEHRVKAGETLTSIARAYRTTVQALERANPFLNRRPLEVGDLLVVSPH